MVVELKFAIGILERFSFEGLRKKMNFYCIFLHNNELNLPEWQHKHPNRRVHPRSTRWLFQAQHLSLAKMVAAAVVAYEILAVVQVHRMHHRHIRKNRCQTFSTSENGNDLNIGKFLLLVVVFLCFVGADWSPSSTKKNNQWIKSPIWTKRKRCKMMRSHTFMAHLKCLCSFDPTKRTRNSKIFNWIRFFLSTSVSVSLDAD